MAKSSGMTNDALVPPKLPAQIDVVDDCGLHPGVPRCSDHCIETLCPRLFTTDLVARPTFIRQCLDTEILCQLY
jgi:hypothetical protein